MIYLHIFSPVIALGINVISQVGFCRYVSGRNLLGSVSFGFSCGLSSLVLIEIYHWCQADLFVPSGIFSIFTNALSYSALGYCYFHFINLGETARRIRIAIELAAVKDGLSLTQILKQYNAREITEKRLSRLLKSSQITYRNNRYYLKGHFMLFAAKIIIFLKWFVLGRKSEFDC